MTKNLSIIGSSRIVEEHIKAAIKVGFKIKYIYSSNKFSKNAKIISKKYKIENVTNFNIFLKKFRKIKSNILIAGRIVDNKKFLDTFIKTQSKIFIEKPVFINSKEFKPYLKYNRKIFVGYNRIFYTSIKLLKSILIKEKNLEVICNCPENNISRIASNASHIISILIYLFGKPRIIYKEKKNKKIFVRLKAYRGVNINIVFYFKALNNYSIEIFNDKLNVLVKPIEIMNIHKTLIKKRLGNNNFYSMKPNKKINEYKINNLKPGILEQMKSFYLFCTNKKSKINKILFIKKIMKLCNEMIK